MNNYINIVKQMIADGHITQKVAENYFPELAESEDEKIRNMLIEYIKGCHSSTFPMHGFSRDSIIAWLEKPKLENILVNVDNLIEQYKLNELNKEEERDLARSIIFTKADVYKQGVIDAISAFGLEQKPADIQPQFKVGDWVITVLGNIYHIDNITNNRYEASNIEGGGANWQLDINTIRLWSVKDAKDGDVLVSINCHPFIYKCSHGLYVDAYCGINREHNFIHRNTENWAWKEGIKPATKEQHDLLKKAMTNAGYEWDADKKELKKIEQKPEWSEEDSWMLNVCCNAVDRYKEPVDKFLVKQWLKALISQKQNYNEIITPSSELILNIWELGNHWKELTGGSISTEHGTQLKYIQKHWSEGDYFDKLKPQKQWKPTKEQLKELEIVAKDNHLNPNLQILLEQLKQL